MFTGIIETTGIIKDIYIKYQNLKLILIKTLNLPINLTNYFV